MTAKAGHYIVFWNSGPLNSRFPQIVYSFATPQRYHHRSVRSYQDAPRWAIERSRWLLLLERGMLSRRLFALRHHCCSSAAT